MGLRLFFLSNFPGSMFIQGASFIPDSRVYFCNTVSVLINKIDEHNVSIFIVSFPDCDFTEGSCGFMDQSNGQDCRRCCT